jgi:hypothetical protein
MDWPPIFVPAGSPRTVSEDAIPQLIAKAGVTLLTALLLAPLAALHATRNLPGVPRLGILRVGFFQALETFDAMISNAWN